MKLLSLAVACAMLFAAPPAAAQITVTGIRNLAFGGVVRGVPSSVSPRHAVKSGQFRFVTAIGNTVRLQFTLPTRLNGPVGGETERSASRPRTPSRWDPARAACR